MKWSIDIRVEQLGLGNFKAIDEQSYDADIEGECCPVGHGTTKWEAIEDLLEEIKKGEHEAMYAAGQEGYCSDCEPGTAMHWDEKSRTFTHPHESKS